MLALLSLVITNVSITIITNNYVTTDDNVSEDATRNEQWTIKYIHLIDLNGQYNFNFFFFLSFNGLHVKTSLTDKQAYVFEKQPART